MIAAAAAAAALACHPEPGLGTIAYSRSGRRHIVDLATCRERIERAKAQKPKPLVSPDGRSVATVVVERRGLRGTQAIVIRDRATGSTRTVFTVHESYDRIPAGAPGPIVLYRWSGDGRWIFFAIDPQGSQSLAADGLLLQVVSARGGQPRDITSTLAYPDYLAWCAGRLVLTAGGDRLATTNKRLLVASPPNWRTRPLVKTPGRAWGSLVCAPDGQSVVAQSQPQSKDYSFLHTHWALWRIGLDGSRTQLTFPPASSTDESPRLSRDGRTLLFVRTRRLVGRLYALRGKRLLGPLLSLGNGLGYYGHDNWWLTTDWSLGS